jgi:hypothetical protein
MPHSRQSRLDAAERVADIYGRCPAVTSILLVGSVATHDDDDRSDLDLIVLWEKIDGDRLKHPPLQSLGADRFTYACACGSSLEQYLLNGLKVDIAHSEWSKTESNVRQVVEQLAAGASLLKELSILSEAVVIRGARPFGRLKSLVHSYPPKLAERLIGQHLLFYPRPVLETLLCRGDQIGYYDALLLQTKQITAVLAAINRRYYAPEGDQKILERLFRRLEIVPHDGWARIRAPFARPDTSSLSGFYGLIDETIHLVESHHPAVATDRARQILSLTI